MLVRPDGNDAKPWLTVVIDDYSRAVAGYFSPLRSLDPAYVPGIAPAIWRNEDSRWIVCGIPDILYTDHGSDFTSHHLEQVSADLKIQLVFSLPGKPRGRGRIGRFFSTVNEMFLCELDGYAPAGALCAESQRSRWQTWMPSCVGFSWISTTAANTPNKDPARRAMGKKR